jgi:hypothetical protein
MTRQEFVRRFVLMEMADDYENLEHICSLVAQHGSRCGLTIPRSEIIQAIVGLIETDLAKAYRLSARSPSVYTFPGVPSREELEDCSTYFFVTPEGLGLAASGGNWYPFDDLGDLRDDWVPPDT